MSGAYRIIEGDDKFTFIYELQQALNEGYSIVSSNTLWNFNNNCIGYYAMLFKTNLSQNDDIPLTLVETT